MAGGRLGVNAGGVPTKVSKSSFCRFVEINGKKYSNEPTQLDMNRAPKIKKQKLVEA